VEPLLVVSLDYNSQNSQATSSDEKSSDRKSDP
jgi:hypothetical protein